MSKEAYTVVWSGRDSLLPDREERWDSRYAAMPSYDIDEGEGVKEGPKRPYNLTGKHKGKFSRTNPTVKHYKPTQCRHRFDYSKDRTKMICKLCKAEQSRG